MAEPDNRTTLATAWAHFFAHMDDLVGVSGIRAVVEGEANYDAHPVPFVAILLQKAKKVRSYDADAVWDAAVKIRVVTDVTTKGSPTAAILSKIAAIQDRIDDYTRPDGVVGFLDVEWSVSYEDTPDAGRRIVGDCELPFTAVVTHSTN